MWASAARCAPGLTDLLQLRRVVNLIFESTRADADQRVILMALTSSQGAWVDVTCGANRGGAWRVGGGDRMHEASVGYLHRSRSPEARSQSRLCRFDHTQGPDSGESPN